MLKEKDIFKKIFFSRIFIAALAVFVFLMAVSTGRAVWRKYQIDKEISGLKKEISDIEKRNQELLARLDNFKSDDNLEKEAKLQLNVKRPGEKVVVILGNKASSSADAQDRADSAAGEKRTVENIISNPRKWWQYFFGK